MTTPQQPSREIAPVRSRLLRAALAFEKILPRQGYDFVRPADPEYVELREAFRVASADEDPGLIGAVRRFADGSGAGFTPTHYDPEVEDLRRYLEDRGFPVRRSMRPRAESPRPPIIIRTAADVDPCPCCSRDVFMVHGSTVPDGPVGCVVCGRMYLPERFQAARIAAMTAHLKRLEEENAALHRIAWADIRQRHEIRRLRNAAAEAANELDALAAGDGNVGWRTLKQLSGRLYEALGDQQEPEIQG